MFFLMVPGPTKSNRTDTLLPYTTRFLSPNTRRARNSLLPACLPDLCDRRRRRPARQARRHAAVRRRDAARISGAAADRGGSGAIARRGHPTDARTDRRGQPDRRAGAGRYRPPGERGGGEGPSARPEPPRPRRAWWPRYGRPPAWWPRRRLLPAR